MRFDASSLNSLVRMGPKNVYGQALLECAASHPELMAVCADTCELSGLNAFFERYPQRAVNAGIAEQNMAGIAAGLASEGHNVFISTYASFATERIFEILKIGTAAMHLNVKVVGLLSGLASGPLGNSHYCLDDLALATLLPDFLVLSPADSIELIKMVEYLSSYEGPAYLRVCGVNGSPLVHREDFVFEPYRAMLLHEGRDLALVATGTMVNEALRVARALKRKNLTVSVYNFHTLKPLDEESLSKILSTYPLTVTLEEHYTQGGLGDTVARFKASQNLPSRLISFGVPQRFLKPGSYAYLLNSCGLNAAALAPSIEEICHGL